MAVDQDLVLSLEEPLLDPEQAAALLNVRPLWIRDATRAGRLPRIRVLRRRTARPTCRGSAPPLTIAFAQRHALSWHRSALESRRARLADYVGNADR